VIERIFGMQGHNEAYRCGSGRRPDDYLPAVHMVREPAKWLLKDNRAQHGYCHEQGFEVMQKGFMAISLASVYSALASRAER